MSPLEKELRELEQSHHSERHRKGICPLEQCIMDQCGSCYECGWSKEDSNPMKTFGWKSPHLEEHPVTPLNDECLKCGEKFRKGDEGVIMPLIDAGGAESECAYHRTCLLTVLGLPEQGTFCSACKHERAHHTATGCSRCFCAAKFGYGG